MTLFSKFNELLIESERVSPAAVLAGLQALRAQERSFEAALDTTRGMRAALEARARRITFAPPASRDDTGADVPYTDDTGIGW